MSFSQKIADHQKVRRVALGFYDGELVLHSVLYIFCLFDFSACHAFGDNSAKLIVVGQPACSGVIREQPFAQRNFQIAGFGDFLSI